MKNIQTTLAILCFSLLFFSCGQDNNKPQNTGAANDPKSNTQNNQQQNTGNTTGQSNTQGETKKEVVGKTTNTPEGIRVQFPVGSTEVTLNGNIKGLQDQITYVFEVRAGQTLNFNVRPKSGTGNIRVNQIFSPSGNADGPFPNKMSYPLTESGDYKLVVGESNMEGEPFVGEYLLTISIK